MTINIIKPFKSQAAKTFGKTRIGQDVQAGERFPSADVSPCSGKKIFKFGTATTIVDDNLPKLKPLECVVSRTNIVNRLHSTLDLQKAVQSSSLFSLCADIHMEKQRKILSKVKLVQNNITKLFKPTGRVSAAVPCIDPFVIPSVERRTTDVRSSSLSSLPTPQHGKPKARVVTLRESISPRHTALDAITSPIAYGENIVDERIEGLATFRSLAEASFPSSIGQLLATPVPQLGTLPSTFFLSELRTIEEDGSTEIFVGVMNAEQKELATHGSHTSRLNCDSPITVYLSSDTLSDDTTTHGVGLVNSETSMSFADTSFATSVDAEDSHQFLPGALRGLRRVPGYEDLRDLQIIANHNFSCSDMSCGSLDCDFSYGAASGINTAPLRRLRKCSNLRKLFLSLEPKIYTPLTGQMNQNKKFRAWLSTRCHKFCRNMQKTSASRAPSEPLKATPISRSRRFLHRVTHPSPRVQAYVFRPSPCQPSLPLSSPICSCTKITRSSSKTKKRRRVTKRSMKELKARLDSMDIDPWY